MNGSCVSGQERHHDIPIVLTIAGDPVALGLVASLARSGGNITGLSALSTELNSKRLEILKDAVPNSPELEFCGLGRPGHLSN